MPRGQAGKARRRERRKQERAAEKRRKNEAPPQAKQMEESEGWLSWMWGGGEHEVGAEASKDDDLVESTTLGELGDKKPDDEPGSWWDYVPKIGWGVSEERDGYADRRGDDDNHVDFGQDTATKKAGLAVGVEGVEAELEYERTHKLVDIAGKAEGELGPMRGGVETDVALGHATVGAKGEAKLNSEGLEAEAELGGGLYAASAEAKGELGMKLPFVNARVFGEGSLGGQVGVGGKAEGHLSANEEGFKAGGKVGGTLGVGGSVGWGLGVKKDDPEKGWFE